MALFQSGSFTLNSGMTSPIKVECDALNEYDWATLAYLVTTKFTFRRVSGVPTGGVVFAEALAPYASRNPSHPHLIVDDVLTTGGSMERMKMELQAKETIETDYIGIVAFARNQPADWIHAIWTMWT